MASAFFKSYSQIATVFTFLHQPTPLHLVPVSLVCHICRRKNSAGPLAGLGEISNLFGFSISRVKGNSLAPSLPHGSIVLFRRRKGIMRGDVVLVDHPELGRAIGRISTVGRKGNVYLKGLPREEEGNSERGKVSRQLVRGVMIGKLF